MRLRPALFAAALLFTAVTTHAVEPVRSVPALDKGRYAASGMKSRTCRCRSRRSAWATSPRTYALRADGRISVHNACRTGDGERIAAEGVARRWKANRASCRALRRTGWPGCRWSGLITG